MATQPVVPAEIGGAMGGIAMIDAETQGYLEQEARDRVDTLVGWLSEQGVEAGGTTVVGDPLAAIERMVQTYEIDEIVVSTLPSRVSRWLRLDLVSKARGTGLPVTHVEATESDDQAPEPADLVRPLGRRARGEVLAAEQVRRPPQVGNRT